MSNEHLYPARPGMLRRGTPMATSSGAVGTVERCDDRGWIITEHSALSDLIREDCGERPEWAGSCGLGDYYACSSRWWLDLRDPTARAHAAMAHTRVHTVYQWDIGATCVPSFMDPTSLFDGDEAWHLLTLCRMRCMDESVTVDEARAALDREHAASGGAA